MSKVSILVPVYNTSKYLQKCLDSILKQTLYDIEVICINDGSTDESIKILRKYEKEDDRFKVIDKKNTGYGNSMNIGLEAATGEYIGIVESDDYIDPNMYETLFDVAKKNDADIVKSDYWIFFNEKNIKNNSLANGPFDKVINPRREEKKIFLHGQSIWSAIYKKKMLDEFNIRFLESPGASYQDTSFYFISMACSERVVLLNNAFLHYRQDNPNSSVKSTKKVFCVCDEMKKIWRFLRENTNLYNDLKYVVPEFQWNVYQWNINRLEMSSKIEFLETVYDEFELMNKDGLLKIEYWNNKDAFLNAISMSGNKNEFLCKIYAHEQMVNWYKKMFINELKDNSQIYIYGAGAVGIRVLNCLRKNNIFPTSFVVTDKNENVSCLQGYKVIGIDEISDEKINGIFLVSVKESSQYPIIKELLLRGCKKVIAVTNELRTALKE